MTQRTHKSARNPKRRNSVTPRRVLTLAERHQLKVAHETLRTPDAIVALLANTSNAPTKEEARETIRRLTGRTPKG